MIIGYCCGVPVVCSCGTASQSKRQHGIMSWFFPSCISRGRSSVCLTLTAICCSNSKLTNSPLLLQTLCCCWKPEDPSFSLWWMIFWEGGDYGVVTVPEFQYRYQYQWIFTILLENTQTCSVIYVWREALTVSGNKPVLCCLNCDWILNIQLRWVDNFLLSISETDRVLACVWTIGSNSMMREWKVDLRLSEWLLWRAVISPQLTLCFHRGFHAGNIFLTLTPECLTFVRLNSSFVCLCNYAPYDCTDKITTIKLSLSPCAHMVRAPQSKDRLQSNWHMEKLNLCKWPLGAVLSVLEGLQGHCTHTLRHKYKLRKGCVSWRDCGVVTLLMGPYGHKTNTNCFSSWRCWSHSEEMVTGHVDWAHRDEGQ